MSHFTLSYEDAKKILGVFYNSPYRNVAYFVDILHASKEEGTDITLKQKIDLENALASENLPTSATGE
jgi:hypothetical protein